MDPAVTRGKRPGIAYRLPTPIVRAVLDAGVDLYPAARPRVTLYPRYEVRRPDGEVVTVHDPADALDRGQS